MGCYPQKGTLLPELMLTLSFLIRMRNGLFQPITYTVVLAIAYMKDIKRKEKLKQPFYVAKSLWITTPLWEVKAKGNLLNVLLKLN